MKILRKNFNGCREMDTATRLENLKQADLSSISAFCSFLKKLGEQELDWWRGMGWPEGWRYFNGASQDGQQFYLDMLIKDRDERFPLQLQS